jgi:tRNA threonylcarbamoyl adenosine modification protein YeaZ
MAAQLHSALADFLAAYRWSDLQFLAVARGPGGFTGTRLGVVTARTLGQQLEIPVFPISTLLAYAVQRWQADATLPDQLAIEMPVQRGQIVATLCQQQAPQDFCLLQPERIWEPALWEAHVQSLAQPVVRLRADEPLAASVGAILQLAARAYAQGDRPPWSQAEPFYGQQPVAD